MRDFRLKLLGTPFREAMEDTKQRQLDLEDKKVQLKQQRAEQWTKLQFIDRETEELKRRITASQRRISLLQSGETIDWAKLTEELRSAHPTEEAFQSAVLHAKPLEPVAPQVKLGEQLVLTGQITETQLNQALEQQKQYGGRLGEILQEMGYITADQLASLLSSLHKVRLGDLLVQLGYITQEQLGKALEFQKKSGGMLGDILTSLRFITPENLYRAIATQSSLGRTGNNADLDPNVRLPEDVARQYNAIIIHQYTNRYLVAVRGPLLEEQKKELELMLELPIEQVLATNNEMEWYWSKIYGEEMLHESTVKLAVEQPQNSASQTASRMQITFFFALVVMILGGLIIEPFRTVLVLNVVVQIFYFLMTAFKFLIILYGSRSGAQYRFTEEELAEIDERELPIYTILVPMYKESKVLRKLISNLESLDYPKAKLDVRLLIEADDTEAQDTLREMELPAYYTVLVVPDSQPKTKPKACNFGLINARGDLVVIFDAEDRPDPDQLKKVYLTFRACSEETACVQAKLNYYNSEQNLLTRWFTQEYSMWFELLLPGIMRLNVPIPLGGTSNHFKITILKQLNAWDPYNVTEDADLGIRLYKEGYKTAIVDSRTWEEANSQFNNWIRQRSRWIKGYMQTWLVHMRNPFKLWKEIGLRGFFGFQVMVLATPVIPLLNPIFWSMIVLWYLWRLDFIPMIFPGFIYYIAAIELYVANFFFIYSNIAGVYWVINDMEKKKQTVISHRIVKFALLTPLYWMMMSIAAYKAAWQLVTKPFYWEKTNHGLDASEPQQGRPPVSSNF